ncbi:phosphatase PAP2 family protein [Segetibacter sp. 3557_3]|uniref:phosphatase PAP2 family protein n=1 Tax=Segetibacter sp. 3557_3 TaxID=2547429 RepID=UPI0010589968|nr:phosphatase PAP2 family protein [Segetibacter sp. 3557_3]TDH25484.1 phosphatase PAP2 family protein [Segetibacter sp. 3557_3]
MTFLNADPTMFNHLPEWLIKFDQQLFILINSTWTNTTFDSFFPIWRESITWAPLYLFLLLFSTMNFGLRALPWIVFLLFTATLTDQFSSNLLKDLIGRTRPCRDPDFMQYVRLLMNRCPSSGSFTSSHAMSHFGAAVFLSITLKEYFKKWTILFYVWAFSISYGQVYVGVHYPLDVIGGGILGAGIGFIMGDIFNRRVGLPSLKSHKNTTVKM